MADQNGNGTCHYDQQQCLADNDCLAVSGCVQHCADPGCVPSIADRPTTDWRPPNRYVGRV